MAWPTALDYQEAIQNPQICFNDTELKNGTPELNNIGLPKPNSGAFASVFRIKCGKRDWAVKCFVRELSDQQQRYAAVSQHLLAKTLPYTVGFNYLLKGIRIHGQWYPVVKMEWVQGEPLNLFIQKNINNPAIMIHLSNRWIEMIKSLQQANIAHGDLQHGNVLVVNNDFKLIDYDGMYVPTLSGKPSHELGHRNYQHPLRNEHDFDLYIDNFAAWVIYISLISLSIDPNLWFRFDAGEEHLLFRREDFEQPENSTILSLLGQISDSSIQSLISMLKSFIYSDIKQIPSFTTIQAIPPPSVKVSSGALPDWIKDYVTDIDDNQLKVQATDDSANSNVSWILDYMNSGTFVQMDCYCIPERITSVITAVCTICAIVASITGLLSPLATIVSTGTTIAISAIFIGVRYRLLPVVSQKQALQKELEHIHKRVQQLEDKIKDLNDKKDISIKDETKKVNEILENQRNCNEKEKQEIATIDDELNKILAQMNIKLRDIGKLESTELLTALNNIQNQFIAKQLSAHDISRANIPGIGSTMKSRLMAAGIRTASDIINVSTYYTWSGGYSREVANIEVAGKGRVHVDGIGPVKAKEILDWKNDILTKIRSRMPQSLEPSQVSAIKFKYQSQRKGLEQQIINAKQSSEQKKISVRQKYSKELEILNKRVFDIKNQFAKNRKDIDQEVNSKKKLLSQENWSLAKVQKDFVLYKYINLKGFLKRIILPKI